MDQNFNYMSTQQNYQPEFVTRPCIGFFQLRELLSREVHGPSPDQAGQQGLHAPPEAAHHGPHQANHLGGRTPGRLLQGGPPSNAGKVSNLISFIIRVIPFHSSLLNISLIPFGTERSN